MPLSSAFYTNTPAPSPPMFAQLDEQARLLNQPPPVPDLFKRPITPAVAQPNDPPPQVDQPAPQAPPTGGGGGQQGGAGSAAQMAQAMLLYQMLTSGGAGGFLGRLGVNPIQSRGGFRSDLGRQANAFAGLTDPSVTALFNRNSYFKPSYQAAGLMGQDLGQYRQFYGYGGGAGGRMGGSNSRGGSVLGLAPDVYQNALTFLQTLLGLPV